MTGNMCGCMQSHSYFTKPSFACVRVMIVPRLETWFQCDRLRRRALKRWDQCKGLMLISQIDYLKEAIQYLPTLNVVDSTCFSVMFDAARGTPVGNQSDGA